MAAGIRFAVIGCGLIGRKRAQAIGWTNIRAFADVDRSRAEAFAANAPGASAYSDWRQVLELKDVDAVVVATTNDALAPITCAALLAGKHVLVEKPAARNVAELDEVIQQARSSQAHVHVGFNHRYHPAIAKAHELYAKGTIGEGMFVRGRYGHGGRIGYESEWRADPKIAGGGELIDQGVHLIDLARWFMGEFPEVEGFVKTYFWDMDVEDNAFMLLRSEAGQGAFLHVSSTEWKNMFSFEVYGKTGKLQIDGLGGSYGLERLTHYAMLPEMGPPDTFIWEFPRGDDSWRRETVDFADEIATGRGGSHNLLDARAALQIVEMIYAESGVDYHT